MITRILTGISILVTAAFSQNISLLGDVVNKNGTPIPKTMVVLSAQNMSDTTDSEGVFAFSQNATGVLNSSNLASAEVAYQNGLLSVILFKASTLQIQAFDVHGRSVYQRKKTLLANGSHTFKIDVQQNSQLSYLVITVDESSRTLVVSPKSSSAMSFSHQSSKNSVANILKKETSATSVSLYGDIEFGNLSGSIDTGSYTTAQLSAIGIKDNDISSMQIPAGLTVQLFDADNFQNLLGTYTSDQSNFIPLGINDKVSSIKVTGVAYVDSLIFEATGFSKKTIPIVSYDTSLHVVLDSIPATPVYSNGSTGCGKSLGAIKTGTFTISSNGKTREYAIDIPTGYDPNKPYRLFYTSHWYGANASYVVNGSVTNGGADWAFFGLKHMADSVGEPAIFIAPSMKSGSATWDLGGGSDDHVLFDDLLNYSKNNLCVDTTRVFAAGFSFGAMMTYSLSLTHQTQLRAVATLAAANWVGSSGSYWVPFPADSKKKIAYLGITGMSDPTCPFLFKESEKLGGVFCAIAHAQDNGCTVPTDLNSITKTYAGSKSHVVYDFQNCATGYPVKYITFDGGHIAAPTDGQTSDDGKKTWAPKEMWKFFTQF